MKVEIKHRYTGNIILYGEYESIKDCLEKNRGAVLRGADLRYADLRGADLGGADLRDAVLRDAVLRGADLRYADLRYADLGGADLRDADLRGADLRYAVLRGADLRYADLRGADLGGAKEYLSSHDFWVEIIRRQPVETFTEKEWAMIAVISIHRLCWDSIKKRYGKDIMSVFEKCSKAGFEEWEKHYVGLLKSSLKKEGGEE